MLDSFFGSPLSALAYLTMGALLAETLILAGQAELRISQADRLCRLVQSQGKRPYYPSRKQARAWQSSLVDKVSRSCTIMGLIEQLSPVVGIGFTMAAFVVAIFGLDAAMASDPDKVFDQFAVGAGTSLIGAICLAISLTQRHRLEVTVHGLSQLTAWIDAIAETAVPEQSELEHMPQPSRRPTVATTIVHVPVESNQQGVN